jgi:hypothetical protein
VGEGEPWDVSREPAIDNGNPWRLLAYRADEIQFKDGENGMITSQFHEEIHEKYLFPDEKKQGHFFPMKVEKKPFFESGGL